MKVQNTLMILGMFNLSTAVVGGSTKNLRGNKGNNKKIPEGVILLRDLGEVDPDCITVKDEATMNPTLDVKMVEQDEGTMEPTLDATLDETVQEEVDPSAVGGDEFTATTSRSSEATMEPTLDATLDADEQEITAAVESEHDESLFTTIVHEGEEIICKYMHFCFLNKN